ncbi:MAG: M48 family metallopeptidase [Pseudomonadales bacterium]|nr:M48 family metallopeptidase [Pseudomonadales bacterium]
MQISGIYYDGKSSKPYSCSLHINSEQQISLDGVPFSPVPLSSISVSPRVGNSRRMISFPEGASFETANNAMADKLSQLIRPRQGKFIAYRWENSLKIIVASVILLVGLTYFFIATGIPMASRYIAEALPHRFSIMLGENLMGAIDKNYLEASTLSLERQNELQRAFKKLIPKTETGEDSFNFKLYFRSSNALGANAIALPHGAIVFTDKIVELAQDDNELIGIMLHEIGHVIHRHSLRMIIESSSVTALLVMISGDVDAATSLIAYAPVILIKSSYSRDAEFEADTHAIDGLVKHGISPQYFANMLKKLNGGNQSKIVKLDKLGKAKKDEQDTHYLDYLSTHPATEERIKRSEEAALLL